MKLGTYNKKRDFSKTAEPEGKTAKRGKELRFVVQKHDASRLHYDFRLEIDGVLVSWAVPKGPSSDTAVKRLAVQTEDHPMGYIDFEGFIPKGQYGGGTVMVWDNGTFHAEGYGDLKESHQVLKKQLKDGDIKVVLNGQKMKGSWHIFRLKDKEKEWLLVKGKDEYANVEEEFDQHSVLTGRDLAEIEQNIQKESLKKKLRSLPGM